MKRDLKCLFACAAVFLCAVECELESRGDTPIAIGHEVQLLVDDNLVARTRGLKRVLGRVTKANGGKPILNNERLYGTVLHDDGKFKLWWRKPGQVGYGYSESVDGVHFKKRGDITGINFAGDFTMSVMIDPHEKDPAHRYKAAYDAPGMAAGLARSADGIHFHPYNNGKPVTTRAADTYNFLLWDQAASTYRLFTRTDFGPGGGKGEWRGTRMMTNPDPKRFPTRWKTVRNWVFDREGKSEKARRQIYALTDWVRHGVHFALMTVYEWPNDFSEGGQDNIKRHERDVMNYYIATSRDADSWDLSWVYAGKPLVPRGGDGAFDKDMILPTSTIVTHQGKHWIYYGGSNERHGGPGFAARRTQRIGLATIGEDRIVGLESRASGMMISRPVVLDGRKLLLNAVTKPGGSIRVSVLDSKGRPIPGFESPKARPVMGDHQAVEVSWQGGPGISSLSGKTVLLRFELDRARLYTFRVAK